MTTTTKMGTIAAWIGTAGGIAGLLADAMAGTKYGQYLGLSALVLANLYNAMGNRHSQTGTPQT